MAMRIFDVSNGIALMRQYAESIKACTKKLREDAEGREYLRDANMDFTPAIPAEFLIGPHTESVLTEALTKYGGIQRLIAVEEAAEWIVELCKDMQGQGARDCLTEKAADVSVTLTQMLLYYGIFDDVERATHAKVDRLAERIQAT